MFALVDCNNFFVSCERVFRPDLQYEPVVILSNNDANVVARSNEVKPLIPMGAPLFKFQDLLKRYNIKVFSSNYTLYGNLSARLMSCLEEFSPHVEIYSIDEAFLDCRGLQEDFWSLGLRMKASIQQWLGLPISVGFGPTKTLAKVANKIAKKKGCGVWVLQNEKSIAEALENLAVEDIWGIGRQWGKKLRIKGIYTAADLVKVDPRWMRKVFSVVGERLLRELQGISCLPLETVREDKKSLQVSRSFSRPITSFLEIKQAVATYVSKAASKLRLSHLKTSALLVYIRTSPFKPECFYSKSTVIALPCPANDTPTLLQAACHGLEQIFEPNHHYQKAGIMALNLCAESITQLTLLPENSLLNPTQEPLRAINQAEEKAQKISEALDSLNQRFGRDTVRMASCGIRPAWSMRSNHRTPAYMSNWEQLPMVIS